MAKRSAKFSNALAARICNRLAEGESLRSICLDEKMPAQSTVFRWLGDDRYAKFREQYARAREAQADAIFDEILDIADDGSNDWMERRREDGSVDEVVNHEHIQRSKLRVDARKWMAGKLAPKKYGEKVQLDHGVTDQAAELIRQGMSAKEAAERYREELG
jgi:hypothetical protein